MNPGFTIKRKGEKNISPFSVMGATCQIAGSRIRDRNSVSHSLLLVKYERIRDVNTECMFYEASAVFTVQDVLAGRMGRI